MDKQEFLINLTQANLDCKNGFLVIPPLGYAPIKPDDKTHPTVVYAIERDWARISTEVPANAPAKAEFEIEITQPNTGMTEEELKALMKAESKEPAKEVGTVTALGAEEVVIPAEEVAKATAPAKKKGK